MQKAVEKQKKIDLENKRKAKEARMSGETDDYAEYQGISALADSDDEETASLCKSKGLTDRKTDHDPEEQTRRKKQKQSSKLANDLEKINKVRKVHTCMHAMLNGDSNNCLVLSWSDP